MRGGRGRCDEHVYSIVACLRSLETALFTLSKVPCLLPVAYGVEYLPVGCLESIRHGSEAGRRGRGRGRGRERGRKRGRGIQGGSGSEGEERGG